MVCVCCHVTVFMTLRMLWCTRDSKANASSMFLGDVGSDQVHVLHPGRNRAMYQSPGAQLWNTLPYSNLQACNPHNSN